MDQTTGYPFWFGDGEVRLELCLDDPVMCPVVGELPDPNADMSMPENFPDESFWWSADALIDTGTVRARLVLAQEAAFGGPGEVAVGQQVAFSRLRIRIDDLTPGGDYHVVTPYGEYDVTADDRGRVFETTDQGCLSTPCDFTSATGTTTGPFLTWDSDLGTLPEGFIGDPNVEHTVTGSPTGQNLFRVTGPGLGAAGIETNLFAVQGRLAQPRGTVSDPGDLYLTETPITITSSFPGESEIVYTTDGSDPLTSGTATTYESTPEAPDATVTLPAENGVAMTLKYVVRTASQTSQVYTEQYTVRSDLSSVTATPAPAVAPAVLEGRQDVVLTANTKVVDPVTGEVTENPTVGKIYYTTNGTRPLNASGVPTPAAKEYTEAFPITRTTMVKAISVPDGGEAGPVGKFHFVIHNLRTVSTEKSYGYPAAIEDIGLPNPTAGEPRVDPVNLELCLDDPLCPVVGELPDPSRGISFPDNFPDESFWWSGEAEFTGTNAIDARLVLAMEAAFDTPTVQDDHQVAFGRIRVRLRDAVPFATYRIVHPYGVVETSADDRGRLFYTDDNGCLGGPCGDFQALLTQPVGPFLRWDTGAPAGYVGDPNTPHAVTGSPHGTNEFTVDQITNGNGAPISPVRIGSTNQFAVQGKLAGGPGVMANFQTGTFNQALQVTLTGTNTTQIRYTLNGSTPTATTGQVYNGPISIPEGTTTLTYIGVGPGGTSLPEAETYTVDTTAPTLNSSSQGGSFTAAQDVTLSSPDPTASIRFTTDGSDPRGATASVLANGGSIRISSSLTLRAVAVDLAGNASNPVSWTFTITAPQPPGGGGTGGGTGGGGTGGGGTTTPPPTGGAGLTNGVTLQRGAAGPVNAGGTTTLQGVLAPNGQALADAPVVLQARAVQGSARLAAPGWVDVATARTAADGSYAFRIEPAASTEYRVVFNGDAAHPAAVSAVETVKVKAVVKLSRPARTVERGHKVTLRGKFGPAMQGAKVIVKLDGPGNRTDKVRATVNRNGAWKVTLRAPHQVGKWSATAVWRGDATLLRDTSPTRTFRVTR
ncbi:MAG TPA: chitobiase/beta-hexosaminidase C-terminal domain-containing protein [Nocardioides sp.]|uniref:chitobiase/beta-hexosaminidase C-terminal domain-containing protein n=1 Tax=Nocardioides sp. TaxID=35761 RepID=UPI002D8031FA|nr:chitobiase/beta-hexosaminidase C-terminal domain-containing protein [Nocardioides sp.]HET6652725.1 chitobiase/beta-hexosaminidase C-terminal domain-containing protein [Nocardioides sp.]